MGGKLSSNSNNSRQVNRGGLQHASSTQLSVGDGSTSSGSRVRSRTLNELVIDSSPLAVPRGLFAARYASEFGLSSVSPQMRAGRRRRRNRDDSNETNSLPSQLFSSLLSDLKCPVCNKILHSDDIETHLVECLTKPRISYNADVLGTDAGECIICFEDMCAGDTIARLPCLCIYHKKCIDDWFVRSRTCPEHPEQPAPPPSSEQENEEIPELGSSSDE